MTPLLRELEEIQWCGGDEDVNGGTVEAEQRANEMVDPAIVESEHAPIEQF